MNLPDEEDLAEGSVVIVQMGWCLVCWGGGRAVESGACRLHGGRGASTVPCEADGCLPPPEDKHVGLGSVDLGR